MKNAFIPAALIFYLVIGAEIVFMVSPFALYYYSGYGQSLNFLHNWPQTAWLSGFFLPHFAESSFWLFNRINQIGWILILAGLAVFLIGAAQIYSARFRMKSEVTGGLYKFVRHPQYTAFAITGLGLLLAWPRFTVLLMYVTMLFLYYFLARKEEKECEENYGDGYKTYKENTAMFIPGLAKVDSFFDRLPSLPQQNFKRLAAILLLFITTSALALVAAFGLRYFSLANLSTHFTNDSATIAVALMSEDEMMSALQVALENEKVRSKLNEAGYGKGEKFLNHIVPASWYLADLPLEKIPENIHGHHQPKNFNREEYKVLFTKAKLYSNGRVVSGEDIIKQTYAREPIIVVKLNKATREILALETPPPHVKWGDIRTPLF